MANVPQHVEQKPSRKWSKNRKLQWRQEHYASMGPNCRNGHPWSEHAKFNYRGYRFCAACTEAKAEARRTDPATFTGKCPQGHAYTRDNTLINNWNNKVCRRCQDDSQNGTSLRISSERIQLVLKKAREGFHANAIIGRTPSQIGKINPVVSSNTLRKMMRMDTPECREIKMLLEGNSWRGRKPYKWSDGAITLLAAEAAKSRPFSEIAVMINRQFEVDFSAGAVTTKAGKLGIVRPARRLIVPKAPKLPLFTTALRFPSGSLLDRINAVVPRHLPRDHRDDVIGEMALAVYEGQLEEADIERRVREFVNAGYRRDHDRYGPLSLDVPAYSEGTTLRVDLVTTGLWQ